MQSNFAAALQHVLKYEGGYVNHPLDPGGATNLGITKRTLERFRGARVSVADVKALTHEEAAAIYRQLYWEPARCDRLASGLDLAVFDAAVNQGVGRAARLLNQAAGLGASTLISEATLAAAARKSGEGLLLEFMALRMRAYGSLTRLFRTFGLGWSRRLMSTHAMALRLLNPQ
jgi:lysozyme family protein